MDCYLPNTPPADYLPYNGRSCPMCHSVESTWGKSVFAGDVPLYREGECMGCGVRLWYDFPSQGKMRHYYQAVTAEKEM